ncbi:DNA cytosine methyltransferase [Kaistia granuli]|uniref:DNA cytosine methyltransferase n=1 Tax=Kaistia granuli TaxID=363259 RepID=UPI000366ACE8|nr:DNA (cytosine-5-)-methyltransferase [Kaistia granuli]
MSLRVLDLFSGIGAFSLGLERTRGFETVAFCEIELFPRRVLAKHWPKVPRYHDIRELTAAGLAADGIAVDAICGGFPCQNVSIAATAHGGDTSLDGDQSGLWFEYSRLIDELRPRVAFIENVDRLAGDGLDRVLRSLAALGYDAQWDVVPGWFVGAPQARKRIWIVAYPAGERMEGLFESVRAGAAGQRRPSSAPDLLDIAHSAFGGDDRFPQPLLRGVDDRPANWVDRLHGCGNAVIPAIPELIGRAYLDAERLAA